jgi:transposase InsO family protein
VTAGIRDRPTSFRSPWQNGYAERLIGSVRRECTDHLVAFNAEHLRRILAKYALYFSPTSPTDGVGDAKLLKSLECSIKGRHLYGALEVKD